MNLFQNSGIYPSYRTVLHSKISENDKFDNQIKIFLDDRYGAAHFLKPVLDFEKNAFFTNGDDQKLQAQWAFENGLNQKTTLENILLTQIEAHNTEVFYNLDPMRYGSDFIKKLPGCVKKSIAWRAAPSPNADFSAYDLIVCNFPSILESYRKQGWRSAYFSPAHDPEMDRYASNENRPIDVLFVGGYSRHHQKRAKLLEIFANERHNFNVVFHLDQSRLTRLSESAIGKILPLRTYRRPDNIRMISKNPIFGRDLYSALSKSKIVLNGAVDMAGNDRGNMRCFEAMGCGALLLSDQGNYPAGMTDRETILTYTDANEAIAIAKNTLTKPSNIIETSQKAHFLMKNHYNKNHQWNAFVELLDRV